MLPGVTLPSDLRHWHFAKGDLVSLCVNGNEAPFAVGEALMSSADALSNNMRGKGVRVLHIYGDALWRMAGKGRPNKGYKKDRVFAVDEEGKLSTEDKKDSKAEQKEAKEGSGDEEEGEDGEAGEKTEGGEGEKEDEAEIDDEEAAELAKRRAEEVVERAFLQALRKGIKERELPMEAPAFKARMLRCRPPGTTVELKKTKWKKLGALLEEAAESGLIKTENVDGVVSIAEIDK